MQRFTPKLTRLESSSGAFRHPRPQPRDPLSRFSIHPRISLRRHPLLALLTALAIFALGFACLYLLYGRNYSTESIVSVSPSSPDSQLTPSFIEDQVRTVTRRDVLLHAIHQLPSGYFPSLSEQTTTRTLASQLSVNHIPGTSHIRIAMRGPDPDRITAIVTQVTQSYLEAARKEQYSGLDQTIAALQKERDQLLKDTAARQDEKTRIEHQLGIATFSPSLPNPLNARLALLNTELVDARGRLHAAESELQSLQSENQPAGTTPSPDLEARAHASLLRARDYEARVSHDLAAAEAEASLAAPRFQHLEDLTGSISHDNDRLQAIQDRLVSLNIERTGPGSIRLFSPAQRPEHPQTRRQNLLLLVLVLPLALLAGLLAAIVHDNLDEIVRSPEDVERTVGLPPVGVLFDRPQVSDAVQGEFVFRLAATLDHARASANVRSFALTSVRAEQGTTTLVNLLANELAQIGNRVLVLDAVSHQEPVAFIPPEQEDPNAYPHPRLLHPELGLAVSSRGRNLPSIQTVADAFRRNYGEYDILLLDCAPLLLSAEVEYQVRQADATLLIAEAGATRKPQLLRAAQLLDRLRVPGLAIVLNRLHLDRAGDALREDIQSFEHHGRARTAGSPKGRSPLLDGNSFQTTQLRSGDAIFDEPTPRRTRITPKEPSPDEPLPEEPPADSAPPYLRFHDDPAAEPEAPQPPQAPDATQPAPGIPEADPR